MSFLLIPNVFSAFFIIGMGICHISFLQFFGLSIFGHFWLFPFVPFLFVAAMGDIVREILRALSSFQGWKEGGSPVSVCASSLTLLSQEEEKVEPIGREKMNATPWLLTA